MSGKSCFVKRLLEERHDLFDHDGPLEVLYCYGSDQPLFASMKLQDPTITFHKGLPEETYKKWLPHGGIVVFDDLMSEVVNDPKTTHLFTKGAHHDDLSPISLEQNMYPQGRGGRTQRLNTQYVVLFKNPSDSLGPKTWAHQAFASHQDRCDQFFQAFERACRPQYGYLFCDMHPATKDEFRFRTHLLASDPSPRHIFYMLPNEDD